MGGHLTIGLIYLSAAFFEIAGAFAFWGWLRLAKPIWWLLPGVVSLTDIPQMTFKPRKLYHRSRAKRTVFLPQASDGLILAISPRFKGHWPKFLTIQTHFSCRFLLAVDFLGLRRNGSSS